MNSVKPNLQSLLEKIDSDFVNAEQMNETHEALATATLEWILKRERTRYEVAENSDAAKKIDLVTLRKMREWDSDDPSMSTIEKIFRRIAESRGLRAMTLLQSLQDKASSISVEMQRRAKTPRETHPINELIQEIVRADTNISQKLLMRKLEAEAGGDVILKFNDHGEIEPCDSRFPSIKISGIKNRLSRLKNKFSQ
jgi:hypothetical protein